MLFLCGQAKQFYKKFNTYWPPNCGIMFSVLRNFYEGQIIRKAKDFIDLTTRHITLKGRLWFLHRCKDYNMVPKSLRVKAKINNVIGRRAAEKAGKSFLSAAIHEAHVQCNVTKSKLEKVDSEICIHMQQQHVQWIKDFSEQRKVVFTETTRNRLDKKLMQLKMEHGLTVKKQWKQNSVVNLSSKTFTSDELGVLSKGLSFAPLRSKPPAMNIINDIEVGIMAAQLPQATKNRIRAITSNTIQLKKPIPQYNLTRQERETLRRLKSDKEIIVTKADKGGKVVLMDALDYKDRVKHVTSDGLKYEKLSSSSCNSVNSDLKSLLKMITMDGRMSKSEVQQWVIQEPRIPRLYGVPKIHKVGTPLRPIVDATDSVTYKVGKNLNRILKPIVEEKPYVLKNSVQFSNFVKDYKIQEDEILVSFDVVQLFPSIPIQVALEAIKKALLGNNEWQKNTSLTAREIIILCGMCLNTQEFIFDKQIYSQKEGLPMGGPLSPLAAESVMQDIELEIFNHLELLNSKPKMWLRMVDDIFSVVKKDEVSKVLTVCNSVHENIKFTVECEEKGKLPFLDVLVERRNEGLITSVYRKPMNAMRVLPFNSGHNHGTKIGIVKNLVHRAVNLCSDQNKLADELKTIEQLCDEGGYPKKVVKKIMQASVQSIEAGEKRGEQNQKKEERQEVIRWGVTYHPGIFEILKRRFREWGIELVASNYATLNNMFKGKKDIVEDKEKKGVVYKINCTQCDASYVGQTGQCVKTRIYRHKLGEKNEDFDHYPMVEHASQYKHNIDWQHIQIVDIEKNNNKRMLLESWHIKRQANPVNRHNGMSHSPIYEWLLHDIEPKKVKIIEF